MSSLACPQNLELKEVLHDFVYFDKFVIHRNNHRSKDEVLRRLLEIVSDSVGAVLLQGRW